MASKLTSDAPLRMWHSMTAGVASGDISLGRETNHSPTTLLSWPHRSSATESYFTGLTLLSNNMYIFLKMLHRLTLFRINTVLCFYSTLLLQYTVLCFYNIPYCASTHAYGLSMGLVYVVVTHSLFWYSVWKTRIKTKPRAEIKPNLLSFSDQ